MQGEAALNAKGTFIWEPFGNQGDDWFVEHIENHKDCISNLLNIHGELIKRGIVILTLDTIIDGDVNDWDMDNLATLGHNTRSMQFINNERVIFDLKTCLWIALNGVNKYKYSPENGLPVGSPVITILEME